MAWIQAGCGENSSIQPIFLFSSRLRALLKSLHFNEITSDSVRKQDVPGRLCEAAAGFQAFAHHQDVASECLRSRSVFPKIFASKNVLFTDTEVKTKSTKDWRVEPVQNQTMPSGMAGDSHSLQMLEDARFLARMAEGDQRALAALYKRQGGLIYSFILRMLTNEMETQEVVQDTFVQIWRRAAQYDSERSSPLAWMIMIARGLAVDRLRARSRRDLGRAAYEQEMAALEIEVNGASHNKRDELAAACAQALNRLPEEQAHAVQLAFIRGWTHEEIARGMGEPLGTVKARIRRGLLALRKIMEDHHG